jgi:hypothetical protein
MSHLTWIHVRMRGPIRDCAAISLNGRNGSGPACEHTVYEWLGRGAKRRHSHNATMSPAPCRAFCVWRLDVAIRGIRWRRYSGLHHGSVVTDSAIRAMPQTIRHCRRSNVTNQSSWVDSTFKAPPPARFGSHGGLVCGPRWPPQRAQLSISMPNTRTQKSPGGTARAFRVRLRKKEAPLSRGFFVLPKP